MPLFCFPLLDKKDICRLLAELDSPKLSIDNLTSPSAELLFPVYDFFVSIVYPNFRETPQPAFSAISMLGDYPELYTDALEMLKTFRPLRKFMTCAGADDFSLQDLHRPESQRTIRFLSAAINFAMYSNSKLAFVRQVHEHRDQELQQTEEIFESLSQLQEEVQKIEQERSDQQPQVHALELEAKELGSQILALNKQQSNLQTDLINLKQESNSYADKMADLDFAIMQKQQEAAQLRSQIVENPQAIQRTIEERRLALKEEEVLSKNALEASQKWKAKLEALAKAVKKLSKYRMMLESKEEQANAFKTTEKELKERKARLRALEKEEWSLEAKMAEQELEVQRLEEQIQKIDLEKIANNDEASKEKEALTRRNAQRAADVEVTRQALAETKNQIEALRVKSIDLERCAEEKIAKLHNCRTELMKECLAFMELNSPFEEENEHLATPLKATKRTKKGPQT